LCGLFLLCYSRASGNYSPAAGRAQYSEKADMEKAYYVVIGIWRETGEPEVINGFYSRADAVEEAACHKHTHRKIRVVRTVDTTEAYWRIVRQTFAEVAA
jgi:hypothetical protein